MSDRDSSVLKVGVIDAKARTGDTSRVVNASVDGGWFEISQNTKFVPADPENGREEDGYIDMNVIDGYNHLVYYSPITATEPKAVITRGKWEVDDAQVAFNPRTNKVYFISTKKSSVERHVYSVNLDGSDLEALTDDSKDGYYSASFSPDSRYVLVDYDGPDVPWQVVLDLESDDIWGSAVDISTNEDLKKTVSKYELPETIYSQIKVAVDEDGNDILANAVEYRPPGFNASLQYPVLSMSMVAQFLSWLRSSFLILSSKLLLLLSMPLSSLLMDVVLVSEDVLIVMLSVDTSVSWSLMTRLPLPRNGFLVVMLIPSVLLSGAGLTVVS